MQNVCDGGRIKHGSDFSYVCNVRHTVNPFEQFGMRQNNINGNHNNVCDAGRTVNPFKLFAMR